MDSELEALNKINEAIRELPEDAKVRVIAWLINKYSIHSGHSPVLTPKVLTNVDTHNEQENIIEPDVMSITSYATAADLLAKCNPNKENEKILIVSAFLQAKNPTKDLTGYEVNHTLKNIGHKVNDFSHNIDSLMKRKPQLMIQTKKSGNTRQAKRNYRVTDEGMKEIERLVNLNTPSKIQ